MSSNQAEVGGKLVEEESLFIGGKRGLVWELVIMVVVTGLLGWALLVAQHRTVEEQASRARDEAYSAALQRERLSPAPMVRKGKPVKAIVNGKRQIMATWIVSGAGDSSYNGTYTESGTFSGQPKYTNGLRWLWYEGTSMWLLSDVDNIGNASLFCAYSSTGGTLPANPWGTEIATPPAPTVAEYVDEPGVYEWDDGPFLPDMPLAPGKVVLNGTPYVVFPVDSAAANPVSHGFRLYNLNSGAWSTVTLASDIFGGSADTFNSAGTFDAGDDLHLWVASGVWDDDGVPKVAFKQYALVPPANPTLSDTDEITLTAFDCTNFVQVSTGVYRFLLIDGSDISLCEYVVGSGTYSVVVTYSSGTALPTSYTATGLLTVANPQPDRTDHALFSRSGTLYWMRRCETGDPVTARRVAVYAVTETTCTLLADVVTDSSDHTFATPPNDYQTQTWGTFAAASWGDLGRHYDHDTRLVWTPGGDATEGAPLAVEGVTRRWYIDDDLVLMAGWSDAYHLANKAFVYRGPTIRFYAGGEIVLEGEGTLHITPPVHFSEDGFIVMEGEATLQVLYPVKFSAAGQISLEGEAILKGAVHLGGDGEIELSGETTGLLIYIVPPSVVEGYSGAEITYRAATASDKRGWSWTHARPAGYDARANRAFGALLGGVKVRTSPDHAAGIDPNNNLGDDIIYCSWFTG
jgi:hypothetical protein